MTFDEVRVMRQLQGGDPLSIDELTQRTRLPWARVTKAIEKLAYSGLLVQGEASRPTSWELAKRGRRFVDTARGRSMLDLPKHLVLA